MPSKNKKKGVITKEEASINGDTNIIASTVFAFNELKLKNDLCWYLRLLLKTQLPQSFREYKVKLSLNTEPFETRIKDLKRKQDDVRADKQEDLFPTEGAKRTQIKNIDEEISSVETEMKDLLANTPEIEFEASIVELKYIDGDTRIVLLIAPEVVAALNEVKLLLDKYYKIELIRE